MRIPLFFPTTLVLIIGSFAQKPTASSDELTEVLPGMRTKASNLITSSDQNVDLDGGPQLMLRSE